MQQAMTAPGLKVEPLNFESGQNFQIIRNKQVQLSHQISRIFTIIFGLVNSICWQVCKQIKE